MKKIVLSVLAMSVLSTTYLNANETQIKIKNTYTHQKLAKSKNSDNIYESNSINSADFVKKETLTDILIANEKLKNDNLLLAQRVHDLELALKNLDISILNDFENFMKEQKARNMKCPCNSFSNKAFAKCKKHNNNAKVVKKYNKSNQTKTLNSSNKKQDNLSETCTDEFITLENESGFIKNTKNISIFNKPSKNGQKTKTLSSDSEYIRYTQKAINNKDTYLKISDTEWVKANEVTTVKEVPTKKSKIEQIISGAENE